MSLINLDTSFQGLPHCDISLVGNTYSLDYPFLGLPFVAPSESSEYLCKLLVSGVWKDVSEGYVLIGGSWKAVTELYVAVSGNWEVHV